MTIKSFIRLKGKHCVHDPLRSYGMDMTTISLFSHVNWTFHPPASLRRVGKVQGTGFLLDMPAILPLTSHCVEVDAYKTQSSPASSPCAASNTETSYLKDHQQSISFLQISELVDSMPRDVMRCTSPRTGAIETVAHSPGQGHLLTGLQHMLLKPHRCYTEGPSRPR